MYDLIQHFHKAFLKLLLVYACSEAFKYRAEISRQNNVCAGHVMGEFVANPQDCHLFYWCGENEEAVSASCPPNMVFNIQNKLCDTQANTKCEQTNVISTVTMAQSNSDGNLLTIQQRCLNAYNLQPDSDSLIFIAHPSQCNQYYMCYYGQALLQECSTDLEWNARIGKCDVSTNAKCRPKDNTISLSIPPTQLTFTDINRIVCPGYGQQIFPHMRRCNMFIYCVKGHAILQQCPFYHYFDVASGRCKWRKHALCIKDLEMEFRKNTF